MKDTVRFGEYTLSGSVFWLLICSFATLLILFNEGTVNLSGAIAHWKEWFNPLLVEIQGDAGGAVKAVLAVICLVLLFFTGMLLDLLSQYYFAFYETNTIRLWILKEHHIWMDDLMAKHPKFIQQDYKLFLEVELREKCPPSQWCEQFNLWRKQRYRYNKLRSFMISYIMVNANSSAHDELKNQLNLWRTSRAISMSILLFSTLLFIVNVAERSHPLIFSAFIIIPYGLYACSKAISKGMFSRMCLSLFSLMYTTDKQN
ncbi:MAG: hypothetical protein L3J28_14665 [Candidatus Polarisedimenticolaceae bacterium]|nr:hypothetical protein [Candidatus Polarisedimenticolaceae bacterium]